MSEQDDVREQAKRTIDRDRLTVVTACLQGILAGDTVGLPASEAVASAVFHADVLIAHLSATSGSVDLPALVHSYEKLAAFKAYVHQRLDEAGVPVDPDSSHKAEGCRIGGRLDIVLAGYAASAVNAELVEAIKRALVFFESAAVHASAPVIAGPAEHLSYQLSATLARASSSVIAADVNAELVKAAIEVRRLAERSAGTMPVGEWLRQHGGLYVKTDLMLPLLAAIDGNARVSPNGT